MVKQPEQLCDFALSLLLKETHFECVMLQLDFDLRRTKRSTSLLSGTWKDQYKYLLFSNQMVKENLRHFVLIYVSRATSWARRSELSHMQTFEQPHGKTNNLHMRKQKAQISFAVTAKLISAFVFATGKEQ